MTSPRARASSRLGPAVLLLLLLSAAALVLRLAWLVPGPLQQGALCPTHSLLGVSCPLCGLVRACAALARLDPWLALRLNPLVVLAVPLGLTLLAQAVQGTLAPAARPLRLPARVVRLYWGACGVAALALQLARALA